MLCLETDANQIHPHPRFFSIVNISLLDRLSPDRYAMRVTKGCARCRHRHVRCVVPAGAPSCSRCTRLGRQCHLVPRFQFKPVRYIYQQYENALTRFDLVWDEKQVWVGASRPGKVLRYNPDWPF